MIGLLPLDPNQRNTLKGSNPTDLHGDISLHFILFRSRSPGFGSGCSDYPRFNTACLIACALVAFAPAPCLSTVSLATTVNSLPLYPTGTLQLWINLSHYHLLAQALLKKLPFEPQHTLTVRFQVLFTSISGFFSVFPRGTTSLSVSYYV